MPATFTVTGTLEGDTASSRSVYVQYTTDVTNPTEDLNYGLPRRIATTDGTFTIDDLAAWDPLNLPYDAGAPQHGFVISAAGRYKWTIPAQASGATVDVADFTDAWTAPVTPSQYLEVQAWKNQVAADRIAVEALTGPALLEDPDDPGTFIIAFPNRIAEDPDDPGTFLIGAVA